MGGYSCPPKKTWGSLWGPLRNSGGGGFKTGGGPLCPPSKWGGGSLPPPQHLGGAGGGHIWGGVDPLPRFNQKLVSPPRKKKQLPPPPNTGPGWGRGRRRGHFLGGLAPRPSPPPRVGVGGLRSIMGGDTAPPQNHGAKWGGGDSAEGAPPPSGRRGGGVPLPPQLFLGCFFFVFFLCK